MRTRFLIGPFLLLSVLFVGTSSTVRADSVDTDTFVYQPCNELSFPTYACVPTGDIYTWQLPSSPTPISYVLQTSFYSEDGEFFGFAVDASATFDGTNEGLTEIIFGDLAGDLYCQGAVALQIPSLNVYNCGQQTFVGLPSSPTFVPGTYYTQASEVTSPEVGVLTITAAEPGTLMFLGSGLLALLGYFKFRSVVDN